MSDPAPPKPEPGKAGANEIFNKTWCWTTFVQDVMKCKPGDLICLGQCVQTLIVCTGWPLGGGGPMVANEPVFCYYQDKKSTPGAVVKMEDGSFKTCQKDGSWF